MRRSDALSRSRLTLTGVLLACVASVPCAWAASPEPARDSPPRLIVLGVDGLDEQLVNQGIHEGWMPAAAGLVSGGSLRPLLPTTPAESHVSWASLVTGLNPGATGIFDFLRRVPGSYRVELAPFHRRKVSTGLPPWQLPAAAAVALVILAWVGWRRTRRPVLTLATLMAAAAGGGLAAIGFRLPPEMEELARARQGAAFWETLAAAGQNVKVLWAPLEYPPKTMPPTLQLLPGLGTPDLLGTPGTYHIVVDGPNPREDSTEFGGRVVRIRWEEGRATAALAGPMGTRCSLELVRAPNGGVRVTGDGLELDLRPGEWSAPARFSFPFIPGYPVVADSRLHLEIDQHGGTHLYVSPGQLVPGALPPGVELSTPEGYAAHLENPGGVFPTLGRAAEAMAVQDGQLGLSAFRESLAANYLRREQLLLEQAAEPDWKVLTAILEEPDQISHLCWAATDPSHPAYTPGLAARHGQAIREVYQWVDTTLAKLRASCPDAVILVVSAHGFSSFKWGVNLNRWLIDAGYLVLRPSTTPGNSRTLGDLQAGADPWAAVDWSRTRAYSVGHGLVYLNQKGREPEGIVAPGAASDATARELARQLLDTDAPGSRDPMVRSVDLGSRLYSGSCTASAPDLVVSFAPGYRVSWQSALGGLAEPALVPNTRAWSGDHASAAPELVRGVVLTNLPGLPPVPSVLDVAPTVLALRKVASPAPLDGRSMLPR